MHVSAHVSEKSQRLLREGKVERIAEGKGHTYLVEGDSGIYRVAVLDAEEAVGRCNCESTQWVCSHILAASAFEIANPPVLVPDDSDPFQGLS